MYLLINIFSSQLESGKPPNYLDSTRKHYTRAVFSHFALEVTAQACSVATGRSKSLLERASKPPSARNHCSSMLLFNFDSTP